MIVCEHKDRKEKCHGLCDPCYQRSRYAIVGAKAVYQKKKLHPKFEQWAWNAHVKRQYGITGQQYDAMMVSQRSCCKICGVQQSDCKRRFSVDHCHQRGLIRGLLCADCNHLLGFARDNKATLLSAIRYLEQ